MTVLTRRKIFLIALAVPQMVDGGPIFPFAMNKIWFWVDHVGDVWQRMMITPINQAKMTACCSVM